MADATDLPLGIYNNPPRVKSDLHWDQLLRIFKHPNYVVHKESTTRVGQVAQVLRGRPDVSVMCCDSPNLGLLVAHHEPGRPRHRQHDRQHRAGRDGLHPRPWDTPDVSVSFREGYLGLLPMLHYSYSAINPVAIKSLMKAGPARGRPAPPLRGLEGEALARACASCASWGWTPSTVSARPS